MRIALLTAHSIFEYDELRILHALGHEVLSIGAYLDPANPSDDKRPALPDIPPAPQELRDLVADQMAAKSNLPAAILDWADTVIVHFFTIEGFQGAPGWLTGNWPKFKQHGNRVIWRTCGQSNHIIELYTQPLRADGLEIVRYSPKERNIPNFAGEDALIRFSKDPADWYGWHGRGGAYEGGFVHDLDDLDPYEEFPEDYPPFIGNLTQDLAQRGDAVGYWFWQAATDGLTTLPAGPGSEAIGGTGPLAYDDMRAYLRSCRAYLYTGTQPAPYTLGLIEAMMTGVPVVSIGAKAYGQGSYLEDVFEASEIALVAFDDPAQARSFTAALLEHPTEPIEQSKIARNRAIDLFGRDAITEAWRAYLG